jgi:hypothetical protein
MNITCVHRNVPKDPTLATEERSHLFATSGSFFHQSVEDPIPVPGTLSLDLRLVRVPDRTGDQRAGRGGGVNGSR